MSGGGAKPGIPEYTLVDLETGVINQALLTKVWQLCNSSYKNSFKNVRANLTLIGIKWVLRANDIEIVDQKTGKIKAKTILNRSAREKLNKQFAHAIAQIKSGGEFTLDAVEGDEAQQVNTMREVLRQVITEIDLPESSYDSAYAAAIAQGFDPAQARAKAMAQLQQALVMNPGAPLTKEFGGEERVEQVSEGPMLSSAQEAALKEADAVIERSFGKAMLVAVDALARKNYRDAKAYIAGKMGWSSKVPAKADLPKGASESPPGSPISSSTEVKSPVVTTRERPLKIEKLAPTAPKAGPAGGVFSPFAAQAAQQAAKMKHSGGAASDDSVVKHSISASPKSKKTTPPGGGGTGGKSGGSGKGS